MEDLEQLISFAMGELDAMEAAAVERRLATDTRAALTLAALTDVIAALRSRTVPGPPPALRARVKAAFDELGPPSRPARPAPGWADDEEHLSATTLLDTRGAVALAGFRGATEGYQLVLASDAAEIDIQVRAPRDPGRPWVVLGQIEQDGSELRGPVFVWRPGEDEVTWEAESDEYGIFRLELPPGTYHMSVLIGSTAVRLPPLEIG